MSGLLERAGAPILRITEARTLVTQRDVTEWRSWSKFFHANCPEIVTLDGVCKNWKKLDIWGFL